MTYFPKGSLDYFKSHVGDIVDSKFFSEGYWTDQCNGFLSTKFGTYSTLTNSAGSALLAILAYYKEVKSCDTFVTQSNNFYGDVQIARMLGYRIVYVKCDDTDFLNMSPSSLKATLDRLASNHNSVVLLSHIGGWANKDSELIAKICTLSNAYLIEDCAHSYGVKTLAGNYTGTIGAAGFLSFYATKYIQAGEGGAVITKDKALKEYLDSFITYGREQHHQILSMDSTPSKVLPSFGNNVRISEFQALALYSVLLYEWEFYLCRKEVVAEIYESKFSDHFTFPNHLKMYEYAGNSEVIRNNFYKFYLRINDYATKMISDFKLVETGKTFNFSCPVIDTYYNRPYYSLPPVDVFENEVKLKLGIISLKTLP